jgi:ectoine hydroxylase-related dioxygenase (phytanoyl-CoA dioxygenase family)
VTGARNAYAPLDAIARDSRFGALVAAALGASRVQLLQDSLLYKPPHDGGTVEWHQDHTYTGYLNRVVSLRIALLPEDASNGCMRVVDGSHTWGPVGDVRALRESRVDSIAAGLSDEQRAALADARPLELAPGDISIHHCLTLHGSAPNDSARARRTIILRMFDGACELDRSRLPPGAEQYFPTVGNHLAPSAFPIVFE